MHTVTLSEPDDFDGWRDAARALAAGDVPPDRIVWQIGGAGDLFASAAPLPQDVPAFGVPRAFLDLARIICCHSDPQRFALLYTLLHRLRMNAGLIHDPGDSLVGRLARMAGGVRRDIHKMRAFVRFRALAMPAAEGDAAQASRYVAWFEPEHHIVRINAAFFARRFANMHWSILTPDLSIHWDGEAMTESAGAIRSDAPGSDPVEDIWKTYYASIFNPARLKIGAMTSEMPRKYWKNMPETALVPGLIAAARARESGMIASATGREIAGGDSARSWAALRDEAAGCRRCGLCADATQTVFGEGPVDAPLMFVGEQPGDCEDLAGRPFVGPAGQMFDTALADAGIDRARAYVTNAVKHFKFEQRGKRRIHATPLAGEIDACRWWIDQERAIIRPRVIVALGATAARSLFGKGMKIGASRGAPLLLPDGGGEAWITVHPSYLLRIADRAAAAREYARFVEDLRMIADRLTGLHGTLGSSDDRL